MLFTSSCLVAGSEIPTIGSHFAVRALSSTGLDIYFRVTHARVVFFQLCVSEFKV